MRDDMSHCPHPARNGRHEVYGRTDGSTFCRACGEEFGVGARYSKSQSSRVRIENVNLKGREAFTVLDAEGRIIAHTARKGKE